MSYCGHCEGQRFDRARVLRALRRVQKDLRESASGCDRHEALARALQAVRVLEIPHLDLDEEEDHVVH